MATTPIIRMLVRRTATTDPPTLLAGSSSAPAPGTAPMTAATGLATTGAVITDVDTTGTATTVAATVTAMDTTAAGATDIEADTITVSAAGMAADTGEVLVVMDTAAVTATAAVGITVVADTTAEVATAATAVAASMAAEVTAGVDNKSSSDMGEAVRLALFSVARHHPGIPHWMTIQVSRLHLGRTRRNFESVRALHPAHLSH
jgi:hypothetical protein